MKNNNYGIYSAMDAFVALDDILDEEAATIKPRNKRLKNLKEGVAVNLNDTSELTAAEDFRKQDKKEEDSVLEVIDVDANTVDALKDQKSYIGKMLLQCNSCKATRFLDPDLLKVNEEDPDLYNEEDECPHCHNVGTGFTLLGQVGKKEEATADNDEFPQDEATLDNDVTEEQPKEETSEEKPEESTEEEEKDVDDVEADDTEELDLPELGDEFDVDDVEEDDTEDKEKKESLDEAVEDKKYIIVDNMNFYVGDVNSPSWNRDDSLPSPRGVNVELGFVNQEEDAYKFTKEQVDELSKFFDQFYVGRDFEGTGEKYDYYVKEVNEPLSENLAQELTEDESTGKFIVDSKNDFDIELPKYVVLTNNGAYDLEQKGKSGHYVWIGFQHGYGFGLARMRKPMLQVADKISDIYKEKYGNEAKVDDFTKSSDMYRVWVETNNDIQEGLEEDLDMATFEGSIANLIDTFTIEDNPVNIRLLNKNGSELGMYSSDDLPFSIKSQMMDTFNTDDNYLEFNVSAEGDGTTVNDLFNYYRPDEDNQTIFIVTNNDNDEEDEFEELSDLLEKYGDYYIDGALSLRTLNIYISDGDLETEVKPLSDEEVIELGKENAEKEETEESLIENIIDYYPNLKLNRINNPLAEEYFISQSINLNEDLDIVYNKYVKNTNKVIIEQFKSITGYEDEVDKFLKEHNISKAKYNKLINEGYDIDDYLEDLAADSCKENNFIDNYDDFKAICSQEGFDDISRADFGVYQKLCKKCKKANINESPDELGLDTEDEIEGTYQAAVDDADKQRRHAYDDRETTLNKYVVFLDLERNNRYTGYVNSEFDPEDFYWSDVITPVKNVNELYLFDSYSEAKDAMDQIIDQAEDLSYRAIENGDDTKELKVLERKIKQVKELYNSTTTNETLLCSVKDRKELAEALAKLTEKKEQYKVKKSTNENYRYDIFTTSKLVKEDLFPVANPEVETVTGEVVDEPEDNVTTTAIVPEGMSDADVEIVTKIDRIAQDIVDAIKDTYNVEVNKSAVVADIIQDLQLVGGAKLASELEDTPVNELTKQMYQEFNGFYDAMDELVSFITGERITTSQADRLKAAVQSLDGPQFTPETIRANIQSPRFLTAAQAGYIPFINAAQLQSPMDEGLVDENTNENLDESILGDEDGDIEVLNFSLPKATTEALEEEVKEQATDEMVLKVDELGVDINNSDELYNALCGAVKGYLGGVDSDVEFDYDVNFVDGTVKVWNMRVLDTGLSPEEINLEEFDESINEYLYSNFEDGRIYRSLNESKIENGFVIQGLLENEDADKEITFTLTRKLDESKSDSVKYMVKSNITNNTFLLEL